LAYVETNRAGDLTPLHAYCALRDLGRAALDKDANSGVNEKLLPYKNLSPAVYKWLETGKAPDAVADSMVSGDDRASRLTALTELLGEVLNGYEKQRAEIEESWMRDVSHVGSAPLWIGMADTLIFSLGQVVSALTAEIEVPNSDRGPVI
jgi:hypothetical protein